MGFEGMSVEVAGDTVDTESGSTHRKSRTCRLLAQGLKSWSCLGNSYSRGFDILRSFDNNSLGSILCNRLSDHSEAFQCHVEASQTE